VEDRDYGHLGAANASLQVSGRPSAPLDSITDHATRAAVIGDVLEGFLARWHGGGLSDGAKNATAPMPSGHMAQIARLDSALARLEKLAHEVSSLG
jgi:hypothetical protein